MTGMNGRRLGLRQCGNKWGVSWTSKGDGHWEWIAIVLMWSSTNFVNLASYFFISQMSCPNFFWMFFMTLIRASSWSPIFFIPKKQIWKKVFHLISFSMKYVWYMHDTEKYEMTCCAKKCLTNKDLLPKHA